MQAASDVKATRALAIRVARLKAAQDSDPEELRLALEQLAAAKAVGRIRQELDGVVLSEAQALDIATLAAKAARNGDTHA